MAHRTPLLAFLFLFFLIGGVGAQAPAEKQSTEPKATKTQAAKTEELDPLVAQRRLVAVSLLTALADDARSFRDQALRARVQARAADAFWETDPDKARALFRRAWDEAEIVDAEAAKRLAEERQRQERAGGPVVLRGSRDIRSEVLRIAAKRDRNLGEEFLKKLSDAEERAKGETAQQRPLDPSAASLATAKRLQLARRLLEDADIERAIQFASPVLDSVNRDSIDFLSALREKNPAAADQGFLSLLARVQRDPASDANKKDDLNRSIEAAKSFSGESPQAVATLAIARFVLEKGSPDTPTLE
jgi:hypothetical protein